MPEKWTGDLIGRMHNERVTYDELAAEIGWHKAYLSLIFNGKRNPKCAEERLNNAFDAVLEKRASRSP